MTAKGTLAAIRFGNGLKPGETPPQGTEALLESVALSSKRPAGAGLAVRAKMLIDLFEARKVADAGGVVNKEPEQNLRRLAGQDMKRILTDALDGPGFGERLLMFWADHFTVAANNQRLRVLTPEFVQSAIRPHIGGRFSDMLAAVVTHPAMLIYLNQDRSAGPNSRMGLRRDRGLNENLARELLELHTLGVDADYSQTDVRNLALLLTGLSIDKEGFRFRPGMAEPGRQTILGAEYGGTPKSLEHILAAIDAIAQNADTARHIARKLVVHFVETPADDGLVEAVEAAFRNSNGDLMATYRALLSHDAAWEPELQKVKTPIDFVVSALRASGADSGFVENLSAQEIRQGIAQPLQQMGQPPFQPPGPDGWSEDPESWITPALLAARIRWATALAERIAPDRDPREFLETTLGDAASDKLAFAVSGAESRPVGIALTLVSPEFNRR